MIDDIKTRERRFHDERFAAGGARAGTANFYRIAQASRAHYRSSLLHNVADQRVLEYGCGPGGLAFALARSGATVTGIDISPVAIEQARAKAESESLTRLTFEVMDAEALAFEPASFDIICGSGILHHLDIDRTYGELARVLRSSGRAVFSEPLGHNPLINTYRRLTPQARTVDEHPLLLADITAARRHFGKVTTSFFHLTDLASTPFAKTAVASPVAGALARFDRGLFSAIPYLRRFAWIVVMELREPVRRHSAARDSGMGIASATAAR